MSNPCRILIVTQRPSDFTEMDRVAEALRARGHSIVYLHHTSTGSASSDPVVVRLSELRHQGKIDSYILLPTDVVPPPPSQQQSRRLQNALHWMRDFARRVGRLTYRKAKMIVLPYRKLMAWLPQWSIEFTRVSYTVAQYFHRFAQYKSIVQDNQIDIVILPEDIVGMVSPLLIKVAQQINVPSLVIPYTIANQQEAFRSLSDMETYQISHKFNPIVGWCFPRWRMKGRDRHLLRLPAPHVVAHELLRVTPPDPWMMNSGYTNAIAVENEAMREYYLDAGIPATKLHVVGAVYDDVLFDLRQKREAHADRLRAELGIRTTKPILAIGGCPNQLAGPVPGCEFQNMQQIAEFIATSLKTHAPDFEVVVRSHPNYPELGNLFSKLGVHSTTIDTARLVATCDLYIAFASATIRWAIACGIPTINYDVFQYDYDDFKSVAGVFMAKTKSDFIATLGSLAWQSSNYLQAKANIQRESLRWGMTDGKSVDRIEGLIQRLCAIDRVPRQAA